MLASIWGIPMQILLSAVILLAVYDVQGNIELESNAPIESPLLVQLVKAANVPIDCVYTSISGSFTFHDVPPGSYEIRVQHEGFDDAFRHVEVPLAGPLASIALHRKRDVMTDEEPVLGDRYQVSVRQLSIPEEAVRHFQKALADLKEGKMPGAIYHLERAIELAPNFVEAVYQLSDVFYGSERYADAEQILARAIAAAPTEIRLHLVFARVLVRQRRYKDALAQVDAYVAGGATEDRALVDRFRARLIRHISTPIQ
jgi:tetratricopeptide (TPR) repeat protein